MKTTKLSDEEITEALLKWKEDQRMSVGDVQTKLGLKYLAYYRRINGEVPWKFNDVEKMKKLGVLPAK